MALERELATYARHLEGLKEHTGKFVLIHGDDVVETFVSYEDAIKAGYAQFKLEPFLVNQIETDEMVQYITRHVTPVSPFRTTV